MATYHVFQLSQGATTIDLNDQAARFFFGFAPRGGGLDATLAESALAHGAELVFTKRGLANYNLQISERASNHDNLLAVITGIEKMLEAARMNQEFRTRGLPYTPVYFKFAPSQASNVGQTEVLYGEWQMNGDAFGKPLVANRFEGDTLSLWCRPHLDAAALTNVFAAATRANGPGSPDNSVSFSGVLGSAHAPALLTLDNFSGGSDDRVLVALRRLGTPANFVSFYELESATLGTETSLITSATESGFSPGSGNVGIEYAPTTTNEVAIATIVISSNVADQLGAFKCLVRCKGVNARVIGLRVRAFVQHGSLAKQYGPYGVVTPIKPAALNEIEMVDITPRSPVRAPAINTNGNAVVKIGYEILAKADSTGSSPKLRCDYIQLVPVGEGDGGGGALDVSFPIAMTAAGVSSLRLDTRDLQPPAGLFDSTPTLMYAYNKKSGRGIFLPPSGRLFFLLTTGANNVHDYARTFRVKVDYAARYISLMGNT